MARIYYGKLVRDRIPGIISRDGYRCRVRRLGPGSCIKALKDKIEEEAAELKRAVEKKAILNELIDIRELVDALRRQLKISPKRFRALVDDKRRKRGGFRERLYLEYVDKD